MHCVELFIYLDVLRIALHRRFSIGLFITFLNLSKLVAIITMHGNELHILIMCRVEMTYILPKQASENQGKVAAA